ncbi:hypothetical protein DYBT9275_01267 [Dyadobacter sp. CECT 9275]|uniref:DUF1684 domain-containing protein n=1 Tax=Dyadobacter helix TaxID=2822344 RepID=A0A916JA72_9BACT|nr:DUF1684 domain-containing protein [Dyadobacter sp. CECT 9275]CAG4993941.1 hypothetical protein DYBT9275_01267 [Dyadobacter sp. CECT 9275]
MKIILPLLVLPLLFSGNGFAQDFAKETERFRDHYKEEFLISPNAPLKKSDLKYLEFFKADPVYRVTASFERTIDALPFEMPTYSGRKQTYVPYGILKFRIEGQEGQTLTVYRSPSLQTIPKYRDYLFLPFKDLTNGKTTYGGGRYIDLKTGDIEGNQLTLDFNKAYNPYCAYSDGYSCPIPPKDNHLKISIEAGEKNFGKRH